MSFARHACLSVSLIRFAAVLVDLKMSKCRNADTTNWWKSDGKYIWKLILERIRRTTDAFGCERNTYYRRTRLTGSSNLLLAHASTTRCFRSARILHRWFLRGRTFSPSRLHRRCYWIPQYRLLLRTSGYTFTAIYRVQFMDNEGNN